MADESENDDQWLYGENDTTLPEGNDEPPNTNTDEPPTDNIDRDLKEVLNNLLSLGCINMLMSLRM